MKKIFLRLGIGILISALLLSFLLVLTVSFVSKHVDYNIDEELFKKASEESTTYYYAYDRNNQLSEIWKSFSDGKREWVPLSDVSDVLVKGFLSVEDRDFYSHSGINLKRTFAAVLNHFLKFRNSFGASTITQQVVKNISGDNQTTISRKVNEIFRAIHLERNHSKDEILELYLNIVPMSENIYGVSLASEAYFHKEPSELTAAEAATIIGITNAPSKYNPYTNPIACVEKRNRVLYTMYDTGVIDKETYDKSVSVPLGVNDTLELPGISSWFIETARKDIIGELTKKYAITEPAAALMLKGSKVILTMSPEIQDILDNFFSNTENLSEKFSRGLNYSMVVSDPYTGNLLGIIGNGGVKKGERLYNYATSPIVPGSTLKPLIVYAPLIDSGDIYWSGMVEDEPVKYIGSGENEIPYPKNSPDVYDGAITLCEAIKKSKNTVAVRFLEHLGIEKAFDMLERTYGFENLIKKEVKSDGRVVTDMAEAPLALGQLTHGVSLRRVTESYNVFPNAGVLPTGSSFYGVFDKNGELVLEGSNSKKVVFRTDTAKIMNQLLMEVVQEGTAKQIMLKSIVDTAGKTGTSGGDQDRLFIGYTPYYTAGIWCGFSGGNNSVGINSPNHLQIWDSVMSEIHNKLIFDKYDEDVKSFDTSNLIVQPYCSISGCLPNENCEMYDEVIIKYGYFSAGNSLTKVCDKH